MNRKSLWKFARNISVLPLSATSLIRQQWEIRTCTKNREWERTTPADIDDIHLNHLKQYHHLLEKRRAELHAIDPTDETIGTLTLILYGMEISIAIVAGARRPIETNILQEFGRTIATADYTP